MDSNELHKNTLERKTPHQVGQLMASKWLHTQLLCDVEEMASLLSGLEPYAMYSTLGIRPVGTSAISQEEFLQVWQKYVECIKNGSIPIDSDYRFHFTSVLSKEKDAVVSLAISEDKEIIACIKPCMQMQLHRFDYSPIDSKFRPMVFGQKTISWGIQLSYPQLFQDVTTRIVHAANDQTLFPNAALYKTLISWMRKHTVPTPFLVQDVLVKVPIRIGKKCFDWISKHSELQSQNIQIVRPKSLSVHDE